MKIINYLDNTIQKLNGSLIGIGIEEKNLIDKINQNNNIIECNLLDCYIDSDEVKGKTKKIKVKKIRKKFKKNKANYVICNTNSIYKFKDKFVYDSLYIGNKEIYLYNLDKKTDVNKFINKYKKYGNIEAIKCSDGYIYKITITKRINKINELACILIDLINEGIELITDVLS